MASNANSSEIIISAPLGAAWEILKKAETAEEKNEAQKRQIQALLNSFLSLNNSIHPIFANLTDRATSKEIGALGSNTAKMLEVIFDEDSRPHQKFNAIENYVKQCQSENRIMKNIGKAVLCLVAAAIGFVIGALVGAFAGLAIGAPTGCGAAATAAAGAIVAGKIGAHYALCLTAGTLVTGGLAAYGLFGRKSAVDNFAAAAREYVKLEEKDRNPIMKPTPLV